MSASNLACRDAAVTASSDRDASATESNGDELVHVAAEFAEIKAQMQKLDKLERERERERLPSAADFM
jgi:hypothetical protein